MAESFCCRHAISALSGLGLSSDGYVLLQRMYHHLTSPIASQAPAMTRAVHNFASTDLGPGRKKKGKSKTRVPIQDVDSVDHITYKGQTYRDGDYIHLMNPDDPRKPTVGQIFRMNTQKG